MELDQLQKVTASQYQEKEAYHSLTLRQIIETKPQQILRIIMEKDEIIQSFSQQITRYKAEQVRTKKLVCSLQQKIQKALPSGTNTSSSFMIASQFKALFTSFMTSTVPSVFYDFTQNPRIYSILLRNIMESVYRRLENILWVKMEEIGKILMQGDSQGREGVKTEERSQQEQNKNYGQEMRFYLLNFLRKYCKEILSINQSLDSFRDSRNQIGVERQVQHNGNLFKIALRNQYELDSQVMQRIWALNSIQTQTLQETKQFCLQLYQICIYMILQQNPWQFVFDSHHRPVNTPATNQPKHLYNKRDYTCIDGFIKEGNQVMIVLKGLVRKNNSGKQSHYHPNIKNFVLPLNNDQKTEFNQELQTQILFLKQLNSVNRNIESVPQKSTPIPLSQIIPPDLNKQTYNHPKLLSPHLFTNYASIPFQAPFTSLGLNQQNQNLITKSQVSEQSFRIQAVRQTQNSQIIQPLKIQNNLSGVQNLSNCIIDSTQSIKIFNQNQKLNHSSHHQNKQNVSQNLKIKKNDLKLSNTHQKKEKSLLLKNLMKKTKKQKNISTVDLTNQKRKISQNDHLKDYLHHNMIEKRKNDQLPFTRDLPKSSKKKNIGKSSRKCSVGKIVSQSVQTNTSNIHGKQKICISQPSTMVMKQSTHVNAPKDNYVNQGGENMSLENKQNFFNFIGHMYQKQIIRPKKSTKLSKNQDKPLIVSTNQTQKQERPLALRAYQNNCLVGKLREKYLLS